MQRAGIRCIHGTRQHHRPVQELTANPQLPGPAAVEAGEAAMALLVAIVEVVVVVAVVVVAVVVVTVVRSVPWREARQVQLL